MGQGILYVVATPIGNLEDITLRALRILKEVDLIVCEDTRTTLKLLNHYRISKPLISYFRHSSNKRLFQILRHLLNGKTLALISEAGTPGISDPGYRIVELAQANRVKIQVVPGASSVTAALSASGLPADQFLFVGFLSSKPSKRKNQLQRLKEEERTLVFFEAPHRLLESLKDMLQILGDRRAAIGRELTKFYEEIKVGRLGDLLEYFHARGARGEFTIVLEAYLKKSSKAPETLT